MAHCLTTFDSTLELYMYYYHDSDSDSDQPCCSENMFCVRPDVHDVVLRCNKHKPIHKEFKPYICNLQNIELKHLYSLHIQIPIS